MSAAGLSVEEIAGAASLERLGDEWDALVDRAPFATPFQRPAWLVPWSRTFAPDATFALVARERGRLVGLAPMFADGALGMRRALLLGTGNTDFLDFVVDGACADVACAALLDALAARADRFDRFDLEELRPDAALRRAPVCARFSDDVVAQSRSPVLPLANAGADRPLGDAVPGHQLARHRKHWRRAERAGGVRLVLADGATREPLLATLMRLHAARWRSRGGAGVLAPASVQSFHADATRALHARGLLRLYALEIGGRVAAALYAMRDRGRLYCYLQGFEPELEHLSPGMLLVGAVLHAAAADGVRSVEMLRGEHPYKLAWGARSIVNVCRRLRPR